MIETVEQPTFRRQDFGAAGKKAGLSAIVPLKNEEDFAQASLNSILPYFDEIVVVFHACTDRTPEIVADFADKNPDRVRAFHYIPEVFPRGSPPHRREPTSSPHSYVYYLNFALSLASCRVRCKWDGDQIAEPRSFGAVVRKLRSLNPHSLEWWFSPWQRGCWWYTGVNLWDANGQVLVPTVRSRIGQRRDHRFWPASRWVMYKRYPQSAYLFTRLLVHRYVGFVFYHLKGMKKDRGIGGLAGALPGLAFEGDDREAQDRAVAADVRCIPPVGAGGPRFSRSGRAEHTTDRAEIVQTGGRPFAADRRSGDAQLGGQAP